MNYRSEGAEPSEILDRLRKEAGPPRRDTRFLFAASSVLVGAAFCILAVALTLTAQRASDEADRRHEQDTAQIAELQAGQTANQAVTECLRAVAEHVDAAVFDALRANLAKSDLILDTFQTVAVATAAAPEQRDPAAIQAVLARIPEVDAEVERTLAEIDTAAAEREGSAQRCETDPTSADD